MTDKQVDARGLACPQPVVLARSAMLEEGVERVTVLVDSDVQAENVQRLAKSRGWVATADSGGGGYCVTALRSDAADAPAGGDAAPSAAAEPAETSAAAGQAATSAAGAAPAAGAPSVPSVVVFVTSDLFGEGDEELGRILMRAFVKTVGDLDPRPEKLIFANAGVKLTTTGSTLIDDIRSLEEGGVSVFSCGTCLDFYGLKDDLRVGVASNMYEIAQALVEADRIVKP